VLDQTLEKGMNVRETEKVVRAYSKKNKKKKALPDNYQAVLDALRSKMGTKRIDLKLRDAEEGKGQIVLPFQSVEELNHFLEQLDIEL